MRIKDKNKASHMYNIFDNSSLYSMIEMRRAFMQPVNLMAQYGKQISRSKSNPFAYTYFGRQVAAVFGVLERLTKTYIKPEFGINSTKILGENVIITEEKILKKSFCTLLNFKKSVDLKQQKLLMVAPLSGHYATLLRGTVEALLPYYDIYITDWENASDVPLNKGSFDLDDYIDYVIEFIECLGEGANVLGVCQPAVPVLAAISIMAQEQNKYSPKATILMGGPVDTRKNPTVVNNLAKEKSYQWFEENVITTVPINYAGFMRRVYSGFLQLTGFMIMNLNRHIQEYKDLFGHLVAGDGESEKAHKRFYDEYLAVMDIPAEFYMQTIKTVFQEHALPKGNMVSRGRKVDPSAIKKTAILCIEGEKDDISGVGQTKAALDLCKNLSKKKKKYHLQEGVGHYGIFNGRKYRENIVPIIKQFVDNS